MMTRSFMYALLLAFAFGCSSSDGNEKLQDALRHLMPHSDKPWEGNVIIIPQAGCDGCITTAESFVIVNLNSLSNTKIVFTQIPSLKLLRQKLGEDVVNNGNVVVDKEDVLEASGFSSIYPVVVYFDNGVITKLAYQSPDNPKALDEYLRFVLEGAAEIN